MLPRLHPCGPKGFWHALSKILVMCSDPALPLYLPALPWAPAAREVLEGAAPYVAKISDAARQTLGRFLDLVNPKIKLKLFQPSQHQLHASASINCRRLPLVSPPLQPAPWAPLTAVPGAPEGSRCGRGVAAAAAPCVRPPPAPAKSTRNWRSVPEKKEITSLRAIPTLHSPAYDHYDKFLHILGTSTPNSNQPLPTDNLPRKNGKALLQAHFKLIGEQQLLARGQSRRQGTRVMHLQKPPPAPRSAERTRGHQQQNQTGELLWRDTGGIHWRILASRSGSILAGYSAGSTDKGCSAGYSAGSAGELLWDTDSTGGLLWWDTRRDPLAGVMLDGIHSRTTPIGRLLWWDTRRDPLASRSGGILGGIHWRAALAGCWAGAGPAGYSAGSTGEPLWRDTRRDPLASCSGILSGIHWQAALAGYWLGSTGEPLAGYSAGSTGELLWRDTGWGRGVEASQTWIPT